MEFLTECVAPPACGVLAAAESAGPVAGPGWGGGPVPAVAALVLAVAVGLVPGGPAASRLAALCRRSGRRPGTRALPSAVVVIAGGVAGLLLLGPAGALVGAGAAVAWWRSRARSRRERAEGSGTSALADALDRITEELRAGAHPAAALRGAAADRDQAEGDHADGDPAAAVLRPAAAAAELGHGVAPVFAAEALRRPAVARDLRQVARAWALAERHGVPLAELLAAVHAGLRWRLAYAARIDAALAGPRATAAVLTGLPALGILLGELVGAGPLQVLRSGVLGQVLVVCGVGLLGAGAAWARAIVRSAVPR